MSAQEQMRKMLDELMGTRRNGDDNRSEKLHYRSSRVCKSFLLNCCPHEILASTRGDMGQCKKIHDVALRADFENSSRKDEYTFQREALQQLKNFVLESERRTQFAKVRLAETQEILCAEEAGRLRKIQEAEAKLNVALLQVEHLGAEGDVEGSMKLMETIEELKKQKTTAEEEHRNATPASIAQQQKLRVCEVCTSYLGVHDNDRRLADHFNGKLHLGFITIREKLAELEESVQDYHIKSLVSSVFDGMNAANKKSESPPRSPSPVRSRSRSRARSPSPAQRSPKKHHKHRRSRSHERRHRHKSSRHSHSSRHKYKHRRHSSREHKSSHSSTSVPNPTDGEAPAPLAL